MNKKLIDEYKRSNESEIVCPFCGNSYHPDELDGSFEDECGECEKTYWVEVDYSVSFSTSCDCKDNDKEHEFNEWEYFDQRVEDPTSDTWGKRKECINCDKIEYVWKVTKDTDK